MFFYNNNEKNANGEECHTNYCVLLFTHFYHSIDAGLKYVEKLRLLLFSAADLGGAAQSNEINLMMRKFYCRKKIRTKVLSK